MSTTAGGNWLSVVGGGKTPGSILVSVNTGGLPPNSTFRGAITITGQNATTTTIPVTLTMGTTGAPQLSVSPAALPLSYVQGNTGEPRYLVVTIPAAGRCTSTHRRAPLPAEAHG